MINGGDSKRRIIFCMIAFASALLNLNKAALLVTNTNNTNNNNNNNNTLLTEPTLLKQTSKTNNRPATSSLKLIIAKTISIKDVNDTILDIEAITSKHAATSDSPHPFDIEWTIFCYQSEAYDALLERFNVKEWKERFNATLHVTIGKNKVYFWHRHLNPKTLPGDVDYIWMMDGDIQIRHMEWYCFWDTVGQFQPSIFAPALMGMDNNAKWDSRKIYVGSTHPQACHNTKNTTTTTTTTLETNDFRNLVALDVWVVESQLPIFSRAAWEVTYRVFEERVPGWGDFRSMWAPDLFWCQLVDHHLLQINNTHMDRIQGRPFMRWRKAKKSCHLDPNITHYMTTTTTTTTTNDDSKNRYYVDELSGRRLPHACMIIHATPVQDLDSRNIKAHTQGNESDEFQRNALEDLERYNQGVHRFKSRKEKSRLHLYRAYLSKQKDERQCHQTCKHTGCLS